MKKTFILALAMGLALTSFAQTETTSASISKDKKFQHTVGVQLNELIRQGFNFSNTASTNNNPFLVTYSINSVKSGWGGRVGFGYEYQSVTTDDGVTMKTSNLNDLHARLGIEKKFNLSPKWSAGVGLDGVVNYNNDYTKSVIRSFDTVTTVTTSKITTYGGGPMMWLRYHITSKVLIGTESSYYYTTGSQKDDIAITQRDFNGGGSELKTTFTSVDDKRTEGKISVPVAFFLIVQF